MTTKQGGRTGRRTSMPTIMTHPAPVLALGLALGLRPRLRPRLRPDAHPGLHSGSYGAGNGIPVRLLLAGLFCAILPDFDVIGFRFGVAYADALGHRGLSHSLVFAAGAGFLAALAAPWLHCGRLAAFAVCFFAVGSHILLDAMTTGGLGVAVLYPFSEERFFLPWRPIRVSPFSPRAFLTERGAAVLVSELRWVWLPSLLAACGIRLWRRAVFQKR